MNLFGLVGVLRLTCNPPFPNEELPELQYVEKAAENKVNENLGQYEVAKKKCHDEMLKKNRKSDNENCKAIASYFP